MAKAGLPGPPVALDAHGTHGMHSAPPARKLFNATSDTSMAAHIKIYSERLFRMDAIRVSKLLEIAQYAIISFWFYILIGTFLNKLFPVYNEKKNLYLVSLEVTMQIFVLVIVEYYARKIISTVPFFFSLTPAFISNLKGEITTAMMATMLALLATQTNFMNKVRLLQSAFVKKVTSVKAPAPAT